MSEPTAQDTYRGGAKERPSRFFSFPGPVSGPCHVDRFCRSGSASGDPATCRFEIRDLPGLPWSSPAHHSPERILSNGDLLSAVSAPPAMESRCLSVPDGGLRARRPEPLLM